MKDEKLTLGIVAGLFVGAGLKWFSKRRSPLKTKKKKFVGYKRGPNNLYQIVLEKS